MSGAHKAWRKRLGAVPLGFLVAAALVLLFSYSIYSIWLSVEPFAGPTVNLAGRQRMLSDQIANETLILVQDGSVEGRMMLRQRIYETAAQFHRVQLGLDRGDQSLDLPGKYTASTRMVLANMAPSIEQLSGSVEDLYRMSPQDLMRLSIRSPTVQHILRSGEMVVGSYDDFMREYAAGAEKEVLRHKVLEIAGFVAAFLLVLQAQFVARGLGRKIQRLGRRLSGRSHLLRQEILARRRSEEGRRLMTAAVEQANESIVITDANGDIQYVNPAFLRITGYSREEIIGKNPRILKSGKQDSEFYRRLWSTISSGEPWRGQMVNRTKDGTLYTESEAIFPIRDQKSRIRHFAAIKHDITREAEMEKQLREAQKLEAIGALVGGIAHDFNNILTPIIGYTDLTMESVPIASEAHENLAIVRAAANRAKDLVTQIRSTVRESKDPTLAIHLETIAKEVLNLVRSTASKSIAIAEHIPQHLPSVQGNPGMLHRMLMNLCVNASQAMPAGGRLTVTLGLVNLLETAEYLCDPAPGEFVRIEVKDSGHGMSEETKAHIFEPYFTTRAGSSGTGFGLFLVFNIVKQMRGGIRVASRENEGATFEIILPVSPADSYSAVKSGGLDLPGQERILFVDDEEPIAKYAKSALERIGYRVTAMSDSVAACALFEQDPGRFDVVFTDRSMPGMSGEAVARRIKGIRPSIPVIMCTGFCDEETEQSVRALGIEACLLKPFAPGQLSAAIRKVMGGGGGLQAGGVKESVRPA